MHSSRRVWGWAWRLLIVAGVLATFTKDGGTAAPIMGEQEDPYDNRPVVKVVSPSGRAFVMQGGDTHLLVVLEVIDAGGAGIDTFDSGTPRFVEPNENVDLFADHIVQKGAYTNHLGQSVMQLIARVPIERLVRTKDVRVTPPINERAVREIVANLSSEEKKMGFFIPPTAMVDVADFNFRVKDRTGRLSEVPKAAPLTVGFAWEIYSPPTKPEPIDQP